jgi:hypothetical protein
MSNPKADVIAWSVVTAALVITAIFVRFYAA